MSRPLASLLLILSAVILASPTAAQRMTGGYPEGYFHRPAPSVERALSMQLMERDREPPKDLPALSASACVGGTAAGYPCSNVDLLAFMPLATIGGGNGSGIWGWTDPITGTEYALMGKTNGTAFVDLTDPTNPIYLGDLPTHTDNSTWRELKVYADHAFIVSEASGHGMQVFDLNQLRSVVAPPVLFSETAHYSDFGNAHNIVINEESGFAYAVGTSTCAGGLHIVNIQNPTAPTMAGCFDADDYTHDAQCVTYTGPDPDWLAHEICLAFNEDTLTIVDVTDKSAPSQISRTGYSNLGYCHQGWFSEDRRWMFMDDELDETGSGINTRTLVWDLADLDAPINVFDHIHGVAAIDHNLYVKGSFIFESNYRAGLRILDSACVSIGSLVEVGFFDIYPSSNSANFSGTWSNYPFFRNVVVVSGIGEGLFVLRPNLTSAPPPPSGLTAVDTGSNRVDLNWSDVPGASNYSIQRSVDGCAGPFVDFATTATSDFSDATVSGGVTYGYIVRASDPIGCPAACVEVLATGACTVPPVFAGVSAVANTFDSQCSLEVRWPNATGVCSSDLVYNIYRDTVPGFTPGPVNRIASCLTGASSIDTTVVGGGRYYYAVRAENRAATGIGVCGGGEEGNRAELVGRAVSDAVLTELLDGAEATPSLTLESPWLVSTADAQAGASSFRIAGDVPTTCAALISPPFVATASSVLSFGHREQGLERRYDGGTLEISGDSGTSWFHVDPTPAYPVNFRAGSTACNNLPTGTGHYSDDSGGFDSATLALAPWAGQEISVRFRFGTDGRTASTAWWIDEVRVTDIASGTCGSRPWNLYRSTVASVAPGWKGLVPLPLLPTSNIDPGWPRFVTAPSSETDLGALAGTEPLSLYRLLDDAGAGVGNSLRMIKSGTSNLRILF